MASQNYTYFCKAGRAMAATSVPSACHKLYLMPPANGAQG